MNNNATQDDAAASHLLPPSDDNDWISRLRDSRSPDFPHETEILKQLDRIRYNPNPATVRQILKYAGQSGEGHSDDGD